MFRFYIALLMGKIARIAIKILGRSGGTNYPGQLALKICPQLLAYVGRPEKIIAITGTNGKTTTSNLLADIFEKNGYTITTNRFGSNIDTGIATSLLTGVTLANKPKNKLAVLEVDERSSLKIYNYIKPDFLVCTNLLRDSLFRNPHPYFIFDIIEKALPSKTVLVLNADDLITARLGSLKGNRRVYYSVARFPEDRDEPFNLTNDMALCPLCGAPLKFSYVKYNHIGRAYCPSCSFGSPAADYTLKAVLDNEIEVAENESEDRYHMVYGTIHFLYDEIAAIAAARSFGLSADQIKRALADASVVSTRLEEVSEGEVKIITYMTKSQIATACSGVFDIVRGFPGKKEVVLILDELHGNVSENMSYIYDTDYEFLNHESISRIVIVGARCKDNYLRLLLAGVPAERLAMSETGEDAAELLELAPGSTLFILPDLTQPAEAEKIRQAVLGRLRSGKEA
ncbi:MAG: MurT ligase domain-containing protein [Lachnospiraceae bacterium]|nr:MurT ligase domain-containing protein [Lachnospiraceae bacterium]